MESKASEGFWTYRGSQQHLEPSRNAMTEHGSQEAAVSHSESNKQLTLMIVELQNRERQLLE
jgi:hypothetical protein